MIRKVMFVLSILALLGLMTSKSANAKDSLPTWDVSFNPGKYMTDTYYLIHAVEEYKGDLYAVAGDPMWFDLSDPSRKYGQVFRSPDGENWQPASQPGFGLGAVSTYCWAPPPEGGTTDISYDTSWDMTVFQDKLYILPFDSCYSRPGVIMRTSDGQNWDSVATTEEFGLYWGGYAQFHKFGVFKGMLYVNVENYDAVNNQFVAKIYRSPNGNPGTWVEVKSLPRWGAPGSFHVFKGALYMVSDGMFDIDTYGNNIPLNEQVIRSFDGVTWDKVFDGANFSLDVNDTLGGFTDYKGYLYMGSGVFPGEAQIWRTSDGLTWETLDLKDFGTPLDYKVDGLVVYHGYLYAYTVNWEIGGSVFRSKDAKNWERVSEPGWGDPTNGCTHLESDQVVFKDELYMGVIGPQGKLLKLMHPDK